MDRTDAQPDDRQSIRSRREQLAEGERAYRIARRRRNRSDGVMHLGEPGRAHEVRRVRDLIAAELLPPLDLDEKLPTEEEIAVQFATTRNCARLALQELAIEGNVRRSTGSGTFPTYRKRSSRFDFLLDASTYAHRESGDQSIDVLAFEIVDATTSPLPIEDFLPGTTRIVIYDRLVSTQSTPFDLRTCYVPLRDEEFVTEDDVYSGMYVLLERLGRVGLTAERTVSAIPADESASIHLRCAVGDPLLFVHSVIANADGETVMVSHARHISSVQPIVFEAVRAGGGDASDI